MFYTPGQRQGLGIGGQRGAADAPWFVLRKDLTRNVLVVGQGHDHPALLSRTLEADQVHWIPRDAPPRRFRALARCRHRQPLQACTVDWDGDGILRVTFDEPQRALTPGQACVLYRDGECLGGGIIR
jgi:tRNA-specific 2-thiouridylase